jgi:hypothetical protein
MVSAENLEIIYPQTNDCLLLENQIQRLTNNQYYWSTKGVNFQYEATKNYLDKKKQQYKQLDCDKKIIEFKQKKLDVVVDKFKGIDKERIETESFSQVKNRNILGFSVLVLALGMIIFITNKK